jgi:hypothetical protein
MQQGTINLVRGDDQTIGVSVFTSSGTPFNLNGYSLIFTARQAQSYISPVLLTEITTGHINPISGLTQLTFASADTKNIDDLQHFFDIKLISSGATGTTTTLMYGNFQVLPF